MEKSVYSAHFEERGISFVYPCHDDVWEKLVWWWSRFKEPPSSARIAPLVSHGLYKTKDCTTASASLAIRTGSQMSLDHNTHPDSVSVNAPMLCSTLTATLLASPHGGDTSQNAGSFKQ